MGAVTFQSLFYNFFCNILVFYIAETSLIAEQFTRKSKAVYLSILILCGLAYYFLSIPIYYLLAITILAVGILTERHLINMLLSLFGYLFFVVWDYILLFLFYHLFGITQEMTYQILLYNICFMLVLFTTSYLLLRLVRRLFQCLPTGDKTVSKSLIYCLLGFLFICAIIFIMNFSYEQSYGFSQKMAEANLHLFLIYFTLTGGLITVIVLSIYRASKAREEVARMEYLEQYTNELEELYLNLRGFKHDYANILYSMQDYLDSQNYDALQQYYQKELQPLMTALDANNPSIEQLGNMKIPEIKSILYLKIIEAEKRNIKVCLEIKWQIEHIAMNAVDLSRIIGIFLDNSIEALSENPDTEKCINIACIKSDDRTTIIVSNPVSESDINLCSIQKPGISSKGSSHGLGLYNVQKILGTYSNAVLMTQCDGTCFTQTLDVFTVEEENND